MSLKWPVATDIPVLMAALQIQRKTQNVRQTLQARAILQIPCLSISPFSTIFSK